MRQFRIGIRVIVTGTILVIQLGLSGLLGVDAFIRRLHAINWIVLIPYATYACLVLLPWAFRPSSTWRGMLHGIALSYAVLIPTVAWSVRESLCLSDQPDETHGLLRRSLVEQFAQRMTFVSGTFIVTGSTRAIQECWLAKCEQEDAALDVLMTQIVEDETRHAAVTTAARRRRAAVDVENTE